MKLSLTGAEPGSDDRSNQESLNSAKGSSADHNKHTSNMEEEDCTSADKELDYDSDKLERGPW